MGQEYQRLLTIYRRVEEVLYGSVYPLRVDASEATGDIPLGKWKSPFVVSKQLGQHEVIYGSILHLMREAARPIFRMKAHQEELLESLPPDIRESMVDSYAGNVWISTLPAGVSKPLFIYKQDEITKDALMLSGLHVRTLIEIFGHRGNRRIPTYDYEGNPTGGVLLQKLFGALFHHRYCVVSGGFIYDIFSDEDTEGLPDEFGTKIESGRLLTEVIEFLLGITVNDFAGMLRGRLNRLAIDSKTSDIVFVHQNVYVLTEVVRHRIGDAGFQPFLNYLFGSLTADETREIEVARESNSTSLTLERRFTAPRFKLGPDLDGKVIEMTVTINDKVEAFVFSQQEFLEELRATCGSESLIPINRLRQQIDDLGEPG